jgi:hypothetical protein
MRSCQAGGFCDYGYDAYVRVEASAHGGDYGVCKGIRNRSASNASSHTE